MKAIMYDGSIKEIDTKTIFNDQYITTEGERIYDHNIIRIVDDVRLGEFYCCSVKQGTYEEVAAAIAEERKNINKCEDCWWYQRGNRIESECHKEIIKEKDKVTYHETTAYTRTCKYNRLYNEGKCKYDIDEKPRLFREVNSCFFCEHPEGIPDMTEFVEFLINNSEKYGIVPRWSDTLMNHNFKHDKPFGSYRFEKASYARYFELSNAKNCYRFYINFKNKSFILDNGLGVKEVRRFSEHRAINNKYTDAPICNWDKFANWIFPIIDDFNAFKNQEVE